LLDAKPQATTKALAPFCFAPRVPILAVFEAGRVKHFSFVGGVWHNSRWHNSLGADQRPIRTRKLIVDGPAFSSARFDLAGTKKTALDGTPIMFEKSSTFRTLLAPLRTLSVKRRPPEKIVFWFMGQSLSAASNDATLLPGTSPRAI